MSAENINAFFTKASADEDLAQKVAAIHEQANVTIAAALAKLSEETGAPFTAKDYLAEQASALSDEALAAVTGGKKPSGWSFLLGPIWTSEQRRFDITAEK